MEYRNELLDEWVGQAVLASLLKDPAMDDESYDKLEKDPLFARTEMLQSVRAMYEFVGYDSIGVTLLPLEEGASRFFVPWGSVISIEILEEQEEVPDE